MWMKVDRRPCYFLFDPKYKEVAKMNYKVGTVKELCRYPVKSMGGEVLAQAEVIKSGLVGDRNWAIRDESSNELSSVRKTPLLLQCAAGYIEEPCKGQIGADIPHVNIALPDGSNFDTSEQSKDALLSDFLKKDVSLWPLQPRSNWKFYLLKTMNSEASLKRQFNTKQDLPSMASLSWSKLLELTVFATPLGRFYDMYPLHIITSNSIESLNAIEPDGDFQPKRFRPNIYIESIDKKHNLDEFSWVGGLLYIGETVLRCESRTVRCSMPAQPQHGLSKNTKILRALEQHTGRHLGINASVIKAGSIKHGDAVYWEPESKYSLRKLIRPLSDKIRNSFIQTTLKLGNLLEKK